MPPAAPPGVAGLRSTASEVLDLGDNAIAWDNRAPCPSAACRSEYRCSARARWPGAGCGRIRPASTDAWKCWGPESPPPWPDRRRQLSFGDACDQVVPFRTPAERGNGKPQSGQYCFIAHEWTEYHARRMDALLGAIQPRSPGRYGVTLRPSRLSCKVKAESGTAVRTELCGTTGLSSAIPPSMRG